MRNSNSGNDIVIKLPKIALKEERRTFVRMHIYFQDLNMGFKLRLRPFIGVYGTFLKVKVKGQLLVVVGHDA